MTMAKSAKTDAPAAADTPAAADAPAAAEPVTAVALPADPAFMEAPGGMVLKIKRRVSIPVLPWANGMTIVCRFVEAIHKGKEIKEGARGKPKMEVAMVAEIEGVNGDHRTLICGEVLQRELAENYPNDAYVGGWFHMTKIAPREGRQYATYLINEIEDPRG